MKRNEKIAKRMQALKNNGTDLAKIRSLVSSLASGSDIDAIMALIK